MNENRFNACCDGCYEGRECEKAKMSESGGELRTKQANTEHAVRRNESKKKYRTLRFNSNSIFGGIITYYRISEKASIRAMPAGDDLMEVIIKGPFENLRLEDVTSFNLI